MCLQVPKQMEYKYICVVIIHTERLIQNKKKKAKARQTIRQSIVFIYFGIINN